MFFPGNPLDILSCVGLQSSQYFFCVKCFNRLTTRRLIKSWVWTSGSCVPINYQLHNRKIISVIIRIGFRIESHIAWRAIRPQAIFYFPIHNCSDPSNVSRLFAANLFGSDQTILNIYARLIVIKIKIRTQNTTHAGIFKAARDRATEPTIRDQSIGSRIFPLPHDTADCITITIFIAIVVVIADNFRI